MSGVLRPRSHSLPSDFARFVVEKFGHGPFLVIGRERDELERQFRAVEANATVFASVSDLPAASSQNGVATRAGLARSAERSCSSTSSLSGGIGNRSSSAT